MDQRCNDIQDLLPWLLNGSLTSAETVSTLHHVKECAACKQELAFLANAQQAAETAWTLAPEPDFSEQLWSRIQQSLQEASIVSNAPTGRVASTTSALRQAAFPFAPAYRALLSALQAATHDVIQVLLTMIPLLNAGSR